MPRRKLHASRWLITGASSGIGQALAVELANHGARLLLTARRAERLQELIGQLPAAAGTHLALPGDLADPRHRLGLAEMVTRHWGALDGLVNNAGVGAIGLFEQADSASLRHMFEVNFFAPVELLRLLLAPLAAGVDPLLVQVGSILGRRGVPGYADYSATKFALQGFSESLRSELAPRGIELLMVNPGTTRSEFFDHLLAQQGPLAGQAGRGGVSAASVARATRRAIQRRRREIVPSWSGRALLWANRLSPRMVDWFLARWVRTLETNHSAN